MDVRAGDTSLFIPDVSGFCGSVKKFFQILLRRHQKKVATLRGFVKILPPQHTNRDDTSLSKNSLLKGVL